MGKKAARQILCGILAASVFTFNAFAISTSAASAVLIEQESGRVLYTQNADEERLIASITKIMTAVVAIEHGDLRAEYTVTWDDMAEGSSMYLAPGDVLTLEELLYGLMLSSGNDAALAVAHCVAGEVDAFVALMNEMAQRLAMSHSHFANPNGLDAEGHYASAADMARLTAYALENQVFRRIVSTASITIGERYLTNHNKLLRLYDGCLGVKTGYTQAAGRTLVYVCVPPYMETDRRRKLIADLGAAVERVFGPGAASTLDVIFPYHSDDNCGVHGVMRSDALAAQSGRSAR